MASPTFKHGRHSKYASFLPQTLQPGYQPDDPRLLDLGEDVALLTARIVEQLHHLQDGHEDEPQWDDLSEAWAAWRLAESKADDKGMARQAERIDVIVARGRDAAVRRASLQELVETKARVVAVEAKRRKDEHEMVARAEWRRFVQAVLLAVGAHVPEADRRQKIQDHVLRLLAISDVTMQTTDPTGQD